MIAAAAVGIFLVTYAFIATEKVDRVAAALAGVAAMTVIGVVDADTAFFEQETGIDWNVIFLLFGMMVIVGVLKQTGLFEYLALWAAQASRGRPARLLGLLVVVTAALSALLDNVTTVLLVAPVTLEVCRQLRLPSAPYLISLVFASNIGGTATLIGDPPNIIIASRADLSFADFLLHTLPVSVVLVALLIPVCRFLFRRDLAATPGDTEPLAVDPASAIRDARRLRVCLAVLALVMLAFGLHTVLHLDPSVVAMLGAGAMVVLTRTTSAEFLEEVEWGTLVFFMGLFVLVGALVEVGVIGDLGELAADAFGDQPFVAATTLLFGSAVVGGLVDNIPYTTAMVPIVGDLVAATADSGAESPLWWAFALGADLGGNTTAVAAGANVVVLGIAHREGQPISFWQFTRYGLVVTFMTLVVAWLYVWLRYFVVGA